MAEIGRIWHRDWALRGGDAQGPGEPQQLPRIANAEVGLHPFHDWLTSSVLPEVLGRAGKGHEFCHMKSGILSDAAVRTLSFVF